MERHSENTLLGLNALQRAAIKISESARRNHIKLPIWKNGHIVFEIPQDDTESRKG